jgi:hypothetical protein
MTVPFPNLPNQASLNHEAIQTLIEHMGIAKAVMFLSDRWWQPTDYLQTKEQIFGDETTESVYQKIVAWRGQELYS